MFRRKRIAILTMAPCLAMVVFFTISAMAAGDVSKMTKEELKEMLGKPDVVIIDARVGKDWKASEFKIKGAVKEDGKDFNSWADKYSKDKTLVIYCA